MKITTEESARMPVIPCRFSVGDKVSVGALPASMSHFHWEASAIIEEAQDRGWSASGDVHLGHFYELRFDNGGVHAWYPEEVLF